MATNVKHTKKKSNRKEVEDEASSPSQRHETDEEAKSTRADRLLGILVPPNSPFAINKKAPLPESSISEPINLESLVPSKMQFDYQNGHSLQSPRRDFSLEEFQLDEQGQLIYKLENQNLHSNSEKAGVNSKRHLSPEKFDRKMNSQSFSEKGRDYSKVPQSGVSLSEASDYGSQSNSSFEIKEKGIIQRSEKSQNLFCAIKGKRKKQFKFFQGIFELFDKMLAEGTLSVSDYNLSEWEETVLFCLIQRKFFYSRKKEDLSLSVEDKVSKINQVLNSRSNKRPEECYKYILSRLMKHLKKEFSANYSSNEETESAFYAFYFGGQSEKMDIELSEFHYPLTRRQLEKPKLNSLYFRKLFSSEQFLSATKKFLKAQLYLDCRKEISKKLKVLFGKYDSILKRPKENKDEVIAAFCNYLLKSKACKMPWTVKEMDEAKIRFKALLSRVIP